MKILCLFFLLMTSAYAQTKLLLIGGGKRPVAAMSEFIREAGGAKAHILIFPWASESLTSAEAIKEELSFYPESKIDIISHRLSALDLKKLILNIHQASGIFFTGGDQNKLMKFIKEYDLADLFHQRYQAGVIFGGTSAGTAIMSHPMLSGKGDLSVLNGSQIELVDGLGLLPAGIIVDQHFIVRQRFNRLAGLILERKDSIGIAVDENTSLMIKDSKARVIGPSQVLIFQHMKEDELKVKVLKPGMTFTLGN